MDPMQPMPDESMVGMVTNSGGVVQFVLILLILLSIWSWTITIAKFLQFRRAKAQSHEFNSIFWETKNLTRIDDSSRRLAGSPLAQVFSSGYRELNHILQAKAGRGVGEEEGGDHSRTLEMALKRAAFEEGVRLQRGVTFLATVASSAPFIGLFGTVWGIMNAFHGLSTAESTTIQAVAPGISEALIATAVGLAAAIPAAIAYNYFAVAVKYFRDSMGRFSEEFLNIAERHFVG